MTLHCICCACLVLGVQHCSGQRLCKLTQCTECRSPLLTCQAYPAASCCRHNARLAGSSYCNLSQGNFEKPDEEEIEQTMKDTAAALNLVVSNKLQAAQPKTVPKQPGAPTFIKYTPSQQGPQYASGARERTIKMQDMPVDPMEPPKFRHKKVNAPLAGCSSVIGVSFTRLCSLSDYICATMPSHVTF